jgi:deoxyribodipyrimidine photo-lyase
MATTQVHESRIRALNESDAVRGRRARYVLYWMQQSARAECNHALEHAVQEANERKLPLVACFGLMERYPDANLRHYRFLLEGLAHTRSALERRGIALRVRRGSPEAVALALAEGAALVVCDRGYLRQQRSWRERVAARAGRRVVQVESDAVVPVDLVSQRAEVGARTLRPKLQRLLDEHLVDLATTPLERDSLGLRLPGTDLDPSDPDAVLDDMRVDRSVAPVGEHFRGGTAQARARLRAFVETRLAGYAEARREPAGDAVSRLSPYLHFGQISPLYVALRVREADAGAKPDREGFLEELLVRRELALNFVLHAERYDDYACIPGWAKETLRRHARDARPHRYDLSELEAAETHDPYWNAAQNEMKHTGYMHNHMRMYWGKKILEWSARPEEAHRTALHLNNKYFLDGRDPSSYANVAWLFGVHDRPWPERPVFGKVRSMTAAGLERKTDAGAYVAKIERLVEGKDRERGA